MLKLIPPLIGHTCVVQVIVVKSPTLRTSVAGKGSAPLRRAEGWLSKRSLILLFFMVPTFQQKGLAGHAAHPYLITPERNAISVR